MRGTRLLQRAWGVRSGPPPAAAPPAAEWLPWHPTRRVATSCSVADPSTERPAEPAVTSGSSQEEAGPSRSSASAAPSASGVFSSRYGTRWRVRPYDNADSPHIIQLQTESFHRPLPVDFLNAFTYGNFRAEVVDALKQKTKYSDPSTFQLLVAEEAGAAHEEPSGSSSGSSSSSGDGPSTSSRTANGSSRSASKVVGVIEVSRMTEREVLRQLPGASEYAYISSMCVRSSLRRKGVAQALIAAAEAQARLWREPNLALHVYKENAPAVQLYDSCGMRVLAEDPGWKALLGDQVRLLMHKRVSALADGAVEQS
ncbi:hypothetical protein TSOC_010503 [Tetrabaena socialis]|uniref:N-acetyltransferase domain-containing protein n=1 Tax=Tetrabaena socialis TaxID=47790 RepID=A0A2J7ZT45_9CHLO|nr:hypothetical protein TSOC_010503 [Tetrabaena socialis]|eukprot:PNH03432.1 hypothetical protein TSOC_010503 [Tetrabaena socialis]